MASVSARTPFARLSFKAPGTAAALPRAAA